VQILVDADHGCEEYFEGVENEDQRGGGFVCWEGGLVFGVPELVGEYGEGTDG
jgi:hypothetical protein